MWNEVLLCAWITGSGNQKTSNLMDHAIISILLYIVTSMTVCSYMIRFNMYLEISMNELSLKFF